MIILTFLWLALLSIQVGIYSHVTITVTVLVSNPPFSQVHIQMVYLEISVAEYFFIIIYNSFIRYIVWYIYRYCDKLSTVANAIGIVMHEMVSEIQIAVRVSSLVIHQHVLPVICIFTSLFNLNYMACLNGHFFKISNCICENIFLCQQNIVLQVFILWNHDTIKTLWFSTVKSCLIIVWQYKQSSLKIVQSLTLQLITCNTTMPTGSLHYFKRLKH